MTRLRAHATGHGAAKAVVAIAAAAATVLSVGCSPGPQDAPPGADWDTIYTEILAGRGSCIDCHGAHGAGPSALSLAYDSYADLVHGERRSGFPDGLRIVEPGDRGASQLYRKVRGTSRYGARMPLFREPLDDADIERIGAWIDAGAPRGASGGTALPSAVAAARHARLGVQLVDVMPDTLLERPTALVQPAGRPDLWLYVSQHGRVRRLSTETGSDDVLLDFSAKVLGREAGDEMGLLGLALHPVFESNGRLFVAYTAGEYTDDEHHDMRLVVSELALGSPDQGEIDPGSERPLLEIGLPTKWHHGGHLVFGYDGYMYIGLGDGGRAATAQDTQELLGSLLRIDVDASQQPYGIPPDNPFAGDGEEGRPEIFAWGLRNLWGFSFDSRTGYLWGGDAGLDHFEEIDRILLGGNYGWPAFEGAACAAELGYEDVHELDLPCDRDAYQVPLVDYAHPEGCAVIGGYVVRDPEHPRLDGTYVFSDHCSGLVYGLFFDDQGAAQMRALNDEQRFVMTMAEGAHGGVYMVALEPPDHIDGRLLRLVPRPAP